MRGVNAVNTVRVQYYFVLYGCAVQYNRALISGSDADAPGVWPRAAKAFFALRLGGACHFPVLCSATSIQDRPSDNEGANVFAFGGLKQGGRTP